MSEELSKVVNQQGMLLNLMEETKQLKNLVREKENNIMGLQQRIDESNTLIKGRKKNL